MPYTFDDIKGPMQLLMKLYGNVNAAEQQVRDGEPVVSREILTVLAMLRNGLIDDDRTRFDQMLDKMVEINIKSLGDDQ